MNDDHHKELIDWLDQIERGIWKMQAVLSISIAIIMALLTALIVQVM